tara:strand:- start:38976 stop:39869 length:894 start_codon:yes stop_codon:yes gene_type:complete
MKQFYNWEQIEQFTYALVQKIDWDKYDSIYGVLRGGAPIVCLMKKFVSITIVEEDKINERTLIVDDIVDSGKTRNRYPDNDFATLFVRPRSVDLVNYYITTTDEWVVFPYEGSEDSAETVDDNIVRLLEYIGEDSNREGLIDTPKRIIKSFGFLYSGYKQDPEKILTTFAGDGYDEMVVLRDCEMYSTCEHHMQPFFGKAHIAYIPDKKVVGISKLARLLEVYARRLQIQERLTKQVTDALDKYLKPLGSACIIEAVHFCMRARGVQKQNSVMTTSSLTGVFRDKIEAREEFMRLIK